MISKSTRPRDNRDKLIISQLWKCDSISRKISSYTGLNFEELRDVARELICKIYSSWNPEKANFSTWVNRNLNFYMLNYLRDKSRLIKVPRGYSEVYLKIRKLQKANPDITHLEISTKLNIPLSEITVILNCFSMTFSSIVETFADNESSSYKNLYSSDDLKQYLGDNYKDILIKISNLDEQDENFLIDTLIKKRAQKTIIRKYPFLKTPENIKEYTKQLISKILVHEEYTDRI